MNYRLAGKKTTVASHFKIQMNNSYQVLEKQINHYTGAVTIKEIKDIVKKLKTQQGENSTHAEKLRTKCFPSTD